MTIAMHHDVYETNGFEILISPSIPSFSHVFIHTYTQSYVIIKLRVVRCDITSSSSSRTGTILTTTSETYVAMECCYDSS